MKKIVFLIAFVALATTGFSQSKLALTSRSVVYKDTNVNASQTYLYTSLLPKKAVTSVNYAGTRISGFAKGSIALQYLIDTTGFAAGTATWVTHTDSVALVNGATFTRTWPALAFARYIRLRVTTIDSTQSLQNTGLYISK